MFTKWSRIKINIKHTKIAIILTQKLAKDLPEMTRGCRMHTAHTTMTVAAIANGVAIMHGFDKFHYAIAL